MTQEHATYNVSKGLPKTIQGFKRRPCARLFDDPEYISPEPEEIKALIQIMGWSQNNVAKLVGVKYDPKKGSSTVRRWKTDKSLKDYREIPYAAWRLMLINAGVVDR